MKTNQKIFIGLCLILMCAFLIFSKIKFKPVTANIVGRITYLEDKGRTFMKMKVSDTSCVTISAYNKTYSESLKSFEQVVSINDSVLINGKEGTIQIYRNETVLTWSFSDLSYICVD